MPASIRRAASAARASSPNPLDSSFSAAAPSSGRARVSLSAAALGLVLVAAAGAACGTSSDDDGLTCGDGTMRQGNACVPSTTADGGGDDGAAPQGDGGPAPGATPPTFAGVTAVAPASATALFATWDPATDARTAPERIVYELWVAKDAASIDFASPPALKTAPGAAFAVLETLSPSTTYFVAARALDEAGLVDANTAKKSALTQADTTAPTFAGVKTVTSAGSGAVTLTWDPASDDLSPAAAMTYLVFTAVAPATPDLSVPTAITRPGASSVTVSGLYDPNATYAFVVRARDAAENVDANAVKLTARAGVDAVAPVFGGCSAAVATSAGSAVVSWAPASDDSTPPDKIAYDVWASATPGGEAFDQPAAATVTGVTSAAIANLPANASTYFVCRARDLTGNEDKNVVERTTRTSDDSSPPSFGGATSATVDASARSVVLSWTTPATDDKTPSAQIVYDVYESTSPGGEDFAGQVRASSAPGEASVTVTDLLPDATLYWVVRARDQAGNHDTNALEQTGTTLLSFSHNVQPIFTANCAVVGCHVPGNPTGGLILAAGFAYGQTVNVVSAFNSPMKRILPGDTANSFLYLKISMATPPKGTRMPAPATGNVLAQSDIDTVARWITQGAPNN